ncbi:hypothetical protein [Aliamphritea spongicola]|uniref:hypothetical protein n=1 Tax=Aliamphritea spongicola TaxID=707589 RepID=UPI00196A2111|nr:hypothetical protein [Aliamphritea spongicola]MBN3561136.1 hypothetical protein [Aliamphritea spongicola]
MSRISIYTDSIPQLSKLLARIPELEDQLNLLTETIEADGVLSQESRDWVLWAAVHALRDDKIMKWANQQFAAPAEEINRGVILASSRMAVTNPYFMARNIQPLQAGGSLQDLQMRPFDDLDVSNACGYHYACVAVSAINSGFVCYNSHLHSLRQHGESDAAIDQALRLVAGLMSFRQMVFNAGAV